MGNEQSNGAREAEVKLQITGAPAMTSTFFFDAASRKKKQKNNKDTFAFAGRENGNGESPRDARERLGERPLGDHHLQRAGGWR